MHRFNDLRWNSAYRDIAGLLGGLLCKRGRRPAPKAVALTLAMLRQLVATCDGSNRGRRDRALLLIGFAAALRRSDLVALRVEDMALATSGLRVRRGKTDAANDRRHAKPDYHRGRMTNGHLSPNRNFHHDVGRYLRPLMPKKIGALVRAVRVMQGWTQETLAELSGLQTRTIQRVEQDKPSSLDTHRALARTFGLDDLDYFNSLCSFLTDEELHKQKEAFERDHLLLDVQKVAGRQLLAKMQNGLSYGYLALMSVVELPPEVQEVFASIADFTRNCMDIFDVASQTEILGYGHTLDESVAELTAAGFCLCAAHRQVKVTNKSWTDPTPMHWRITYLLAAPLDHPPAKVAVSRLVSFG